MPLLRHFIEVQSDLRSESISELNPTQRPLFKLDTVQNKNVDIPSFSIMTYNVCPISVLLNDGCIQGTDPSSKTGMHFKWKKRKDSFMRELKQYQPDILCLQEIQTWKDNGHWAEMLLELGYDYDVYCTIKPRPTLSYQSSGFNRNFYGQAIAWKKNKFRRVAYEPFFFDKAPQSHPTDVTPFTGAMVQFSMLEYLYQPPPLQKIPINKNTSSEKKFIAEDDPFDDIYFDEDGFDDEEDRGEESGKLVSNDGDCVSPPFVSYAFKIPNPQLLPRFCVFIANTKLIDLNGYDYERLRMLYVLLSQLELFQATHQPKFCEAVKEVSSNFPHLICGDLGFSPSSVIYQHLFRKDIKNANLHLLKKSYVDAISRAKSLGFGTSTYPWTPSQHDDRYESNGWERPKSFPFPNNAPRLSSNKISTIEHPPRNKLPLDCLLEKIDELTYRFQLYSAYRGYQGLKNCSNLEKKILNLRKKIIQTHAQSDWAPIGSESNDWGNSSSQWESSSTWDSNSSSSVGWGHSASNNAIPFKDEKKTEFVEPIHPNECMDAEVAQLKHQLEKCALIDEMAEHDPSSGEPIFSRFMDGSLETTDYILYSSIHSRTIEKKKRYSMDKERRIELFPTHLLSVPEKSEVENGIPNDTFPSDHICLAARFNVHFKT